MGVYIESLEKPKACGDCPCASAFRPACQLTKRSLTYSERVVKAPYWCPMKEYIGGQVMVFTCDERGQAMAFTCDRKKECNTSPFCGTECTRTLDKEHAVFEEGLWVFT